MKWDRNIEPTVIAIVSNKKKIGLDSYNVYVLIVCQGNISDSFAAVTDLYFLAFPSDALECTASRWIAFQGILD